MAGARNAGSTVKKTLDSLREASIGALDPAANAKAIAAGDARVAELLEQRVADDATLEGVTAQPLAGSAHEYQVVFYLRPSSTPEHGLVPSFAAIASLHTRAVVRVDESHTEPASAAAPNAAALPFALAVPSQAPNVITPAASAAPVQQRADAFFAARGIPLAATYSTPRSTNSSTQAQTQEWVSTLPVEPHDWVPRFTNDGTTPDTTTDGIEDHSNTGEIPSGF